ncbi:MAG: hypothetical protein E7353_07115 [Clostridiales bacterium]|nr:hypothetical protein [Clostridiales bacterium]
MSDKTYWLNKLIKRQYAKSDFIRVDGAGTPSWNSTVTVICVAVMIFGLFSYFMNGMSFMWMLVTIAGGVLTVGSIVFGKIMARSAFSEFIYRYNGKDLFFQYIGKKHIVFACDGKIFEFKDREVKTVDSIYRPYNSMTTVCEVLYTSQNRKGENVFHFGEDVVEKDGKKKVYKYKVKLNRENKMESYTVNGTTMTFSYVRKGEVKLAMPIILFNEIRSAGIELPGDDVIQLIYNY